MARSTIPSTWRLEDALVSHPGLALVPFAGSELQMVGALRVNHSAPPSDLHIEASYEIDIRVPMAFPRELPRVYEIGGKIPQDFHRLPDGALCLGSPAGQRIQLGKTPSIGQFIDRVVIPYLYGHAHMMRVGRMPFDELAHGSVGLEDDARQIFGLPHSMSVSSLLGFAGMRRRVANKHRCPCGSGRRLGRCHNTLVNCARDVLGRAACREQANLIDKIRAREADARGNARSLERARRPWLSQRPRVQ
ncbi:hypothetical protein [Gemmatimonas sp.]|uniref:hypothetical protein n=1 Tax=Gemmatimonas sp. TaxID=1962908 RepID=UPI0025B807BB|nr:hypothetical protein [Gemmatimonas sp.]MCA2992089.1 hypothetical protein [Gemmatimonas sp.]